MNVIRHRTPDKGWAWMISLSCAVINGLTFVILAQYFVKYQATATAISYAGGTVGSFVFPALIEHIIMNYGLKGSFLIIGAQRESQLTLNNSIRSIVMNEMASSSSLNDERKYNSNYNHQMLSRHDQPQTDLLSQLLRNENIKVHKKKARAMGQQFNETEMLVMESLHKTMESPMETNDEQHQQSFRTESINDSNNRKVIITKNKYCQTVPTAKRSQFVHSIVEIITNPMYIILLITHVSFQWAWMTYQMVIFDFGIDQDLTRSQSVSILIGFAVSDLFGRILSGWIADKQIIKKNHIVSICILCIGFFIQLTSMISSYRTHLSLTLLLGFYMWRHHVLFNLLTMEYVGLDNLPVALGLSAFFVGATSLARPYVIGLFRDVIGSYNGLFRYVGTLSFIAALLWLMEPFAILNSKRRTNFKQTSSYI
ncbi:hypothetical protein BLOT_009920 [Blomia tropicalis]|nr:hypothetical protein BLOT_009920 [Blomia tropicalis]